MLHTHIDGIGYYTFKSYKTTHSSIVCHILFRYFYVECEQTTAPTTKILSLLFVC